MRLDGRTILVTGAGSGIGRQCALTLSNVGARVVLADINKSAIVEVQQQLATESMVLDIDLTQTETVKDSIKAVAKSFGKINGFVHCAGIPYIVPLKAVNAQKAEMVHKLNTYAAIELAKVCSSANVYAGNYGSFVLISSVYGLVGSPANVVYAMSKGAIISITKALAMELAPKGIRVNCVAPGFVKTKMMDDNRGKFDDDYLSGLEKLHPLGLGDASAIADPIAFLLSDASRWMTGAVLNVDGGFTAQ